MLTRTTSFSLEFSGIRLACAAALSLSSLQPAMAASQERGPDPTIATLDAPSGPFQVASYKITRSAALAYGYGGATVFYPKDGQQQRFGVVTFTPGFTGTQSAYAPLASRIASHGFVVVNLDTVTTLDQPPQRSNEMAGALKQVVALAKGGGVPYAAIADVTRRAVVGHSMGGGGTLIAASGDKTLKAAVALMPWSQARKDFSKDTVPTMIVACELDTIATNAQHSDVFYRSMSASLPRAEVEVKGADHLCATVAAKPQVQTTVVKSTVAWLKVFLDEDSRYEPLLKGMTADGDYSRYDVQGF